MKLGLGLDQQKLSNCSRSVGEACGTSSIGESLSILPAYSPGVLHHFLLFQVAELNPVYVSKIKVMFWSLFSCVSSPF